MNIIKNDSGRFERKLMMKKPEVSREVEDLFNRVVPLRMKLMFMYARYREKKERRERSKTYRKKYRGKYKEQRRQYYKDNREKIKEYQRLYYEKNREKIIANARKYYRENKKKIKDKRKNKGLTEKEM